MPKRALRKSVVVVSAVAALQSAASFASGPDGPARAAETTIAAVTDEAQLRDILDSHNDLDKSRDQVEHGTQEGDGQNNDTHEAMNDSNEAQNDAQEAQQDANDAQSDAQQAQQDANEASQEGGQNDGQHAGANSGG